MIIYCHERPILQLSYVSKQRDGKLLYLDSVEDDLGGLLCAVENDSGAVLGAHMARVGTHRISHGFGV